MHTRIWELTRSNQDTFLPVFWDTKSLGYLIATFEKHVERRLGLSSLVQLSMGGLNVNWAAYRKLEQKLSTRIGIKLVNTGWCGLQTVHNCFRAADHTPGWNVSDSLSAIHPLQKRSSAQGWLGESYGTICISIEDVSSSMAKKLVGTCERAIALRSSIIQYIQAMRSKKISRPTGNSFAVV